jgi:hypothetical protein
VAPFRGRAGGGGLDLAAEGEGGDGAAEDPGDGVDDGVAVFLGGDAGEVGDGGVQAQDGGDPLEGDQLAELGCPADLAARLAGGEVAGGPDGAVVDLQGVGEVVVGAFSGLRDIAVNAGL